MIEPITIAPVHSAGDLKTFIEMPLDIYRDDPNWVPPIPFLERMEYMAKGNAVLRRSDHILLLARRGQKAAGRIIAYIDRRYNSFHGTKTGFFGNFESADDKEISGALFREAADWLRSKGMTEIMGPINPVAESWGFVIEGDAPPVFMSPHNPLYYNRLMEASGFIKAKDLLVYEADGRNGYIIPERFIRFSDTLLMRKPHISVRRIRTGKIKEEAGHILRILNDSVAGNWGFVPVEEDEMLSIVRQLRMILDRDAVWFVEDRGFPVGVALGFPDINGLLREMGGRLSPWGMAKLLKGRKRIKDFRLWGLAVLPEYQGLGLDVLLYVSLFKALEPRGIRLEANYMLEDNRKILNALEKMKLKPIKRYRVYSRSITDRL